MELILDFHNLDAMAIGQMLGLALALFSFFIYFGRTRRSILAAKLICDIGYCIQQLMIGAPTGALLDIIAIFREVIFYHRKTKPWAAHRFWLYLFAVLMGISPLFTWTGPISLLPAGGSVISVFSLYCEKPYHIRLLGLLATIPWLLYAIFTQNCGLILSAFIQLASIFLGLYRDYRERKAALYTKA